MSKSSPLLSVNQNYLLPLSSPKYKYSPAVEQAVDEKAKELAGKLLNFFKKEELRTLAKAIEDEKKLRDEAERKKEKAAKEAEKEKTAAELAEKIEVKKAKKPAKKLEEERRAAEEEVKKAASALSKLKEEKLAAEEGAEEAASALSKLEKEKLAAEEGVTNPLLEEEAKRLADEAAAAVVVKKKEKTDAEELAKKKADLLIAVKEREKTDAEKEVERVKKEEEEAKELEAERVKKKEEEAKKLEAERLNGVKKEAKKVEDEVKNIYKDTKLSEENLKSLNEDCLLKNFALFYLTDLDQAKSALRAELTNIESDYYKDKPSDLAQLQLRALSHPSLTEIGNFRIPELAGVTLKITPADPSGSPSGKHVMTFTSHENAKAFWEKLSWKCITDGKEVFSGTIPSEPTDTELTLDFGSSGENSIETLAERIRYSHEAYKTNKASVDSRLDRTTKKLAAAALNLTFGVPLVPMVCFGLGKTFQWTHEKTGFGSTLARTFLHTAKLGLENSHLFSLKDPDNKTTWPIGTALKDSEKSLKAIDRRESKIVESKNKFKIPNFIRGASAILTGFVGAIFNLTSIPLNWLGDSCINVAAKDLKNSAKEGGVLTKMVNYPLAAVATVLGAGFRIPGMLCRSAGSILSADANCLADARSGKTDRLSRIGRVVRQVDNFTQRQGRSQAAPDDKVAEKINFIKTQLTDPDLEEVRKRARDIFKNIQSPNFVSSGIPKDKREYCEVAELTLNDHAYKLLFSPVDGAISIVNPQKDLNFNEKVNSWNTDMSKKTDQNKFKELIKKLDVKISADEKSVGNNEVTRARDNGGLSYEKFMEKNRAFEANKNKSKNGEINFKHAGDQYEYRVDAFATDKKVVLHRKKGKDMIPVGGLDEFKIISEVFANNEFEFSNPFAKPSASPKATIARALAEAKTKNYFSQ